VLSGDPDVEIENVEYDSRLVKENSLFFAIKGFKQDGYDFADEAIDKGAVAVMGERESFERAPVHVSVRDGRAAMSNVSAKFYGYPGRQMKVCGVTGTNGKTTTCYLIKQILEARNKLTGLISSLVYDTGREKFPAERTTPEALDMQRLFYLMNRNFCVNAVVEVSSHALILHRVDNINFRVAVYTNFTRDHLDFHKTMEEYLAAKKLLLDRLTGPLSYAVINLDVPEFRSFFGDFTASYIGYSLEDTSADVYCETYEFFPDKTVFGLHTPMGHRTVSLRLPGRFNLMNAVAAAAGGLASGVDLDNVVRGLEKADPIPGRFMPIVQGQPFAVYVDFAHTSDALERLCSSAREINEGRMLLLFGCGGDRDKGKRPLMGEVATRLADHVIVTSDNPRTEDPQAIIEDIKPGLKKDNHEICVDRHEAIQRIMGMAKEGDVVILAGKGAENYQEVNGVKHPFDDSGEVRAALSAMGYTAVNEGEQA
jgi:UDP-N-acetylmuramoyl-L-alanyl-D-glutamate--2,6-diaminopimelate ligase